MQPSYRHHFLTFFLAVLIIYLTAGCRPLAGPEPEVGTTATAAPEPASTLAIPGAAPDTETPGGAVEAFYTAYLDTGQVGDYQDSPYLSEGLIAAVAAAREAGPLGSDPFLLAQQTPAAIRVETVSVEETTARVVLRQFWSLDATGEQSHDLTIDLVRAGGRWQIDIIQTGNPMTPDGVVQLFYNWYFREGAEAAYRDSPYLAPALIAEMDALYAAGDGPDYDPFLLARNWPTHFFIKRMDMETVGNEATVPVQVIYGQQTALITVSLVRLPAQWRIAGVEGKVPDDATSASQVVELFSQSYFQQWYAYADEHDLPHTGIVDLSDFLVQAAPFYEESPYLSPAFAAAATQAGGSDQREDPYFLAAGIPAMMEVETAWADGDHAEVRVIQRWVEGHESRPLTVTLQRIDGQWYIDGAVVADAAVAAEEATPEASLHPAAVVRAFFTTYLQLGGYAGGGHLNNDYLAPSLAEMLDAEIDHYRTLGIPVDEIDPFLHTAATVVPNGLSVEVGPVTILEDEHFALAHVDRLFHESGTSLPLQVLLARDWDNRWRIQQIDPVNSRIGGAERSDEMWLGYEIALYYHWALGYAARPEGATELVDLLRFRMEAAGGITFCSAEWPAGFVVDSVFIEPQAERAWMVIRTSEPYALLTLTLEKRDWYWVVVEQACGDSPAGRALAFYTHYLGYADEPWAAQAYRDGDYLTSDLVQRLDTMADAGEVDPVLPHATMPRWFDVSSDLGGNSARVTMTAADGSTVEVRLAFVLVDGRWLISDVVDSSR
ncbi:MAG: DUF3828 domain-containing protein [Anaerolineae bacterium]|nr:DUF3828 domain-containing protein [Anaerolineae bacterium]